MGGENETWISQITAFCFGAIPSKYALLTGGSLLVVSKYDVM